MDRPDALPTMLWRAACTLSLLVFGAPSSAQWEALPRDSLLAREDPQQRTVEQAWLLSHIAGTWFVSPRSIPYLQRLDTLLGELEAAAAPHVPDELRVLRQQYLYQMGYQRKFRRDFPGALSMFQEAARIASSRNDAVSVAALQETIGVLYRALGEPALALRRFQRCRDLMAPMAPEQRPVADAALQVEEALAYIDLGQLHRAHAMLIALDTSSAEAHALALTAQARIATLRGKPDSSLTLLQHADRVAQRWHNTWNRIGVLAALARAHRAMDDHRAAAEASSLCVDLAASLGDEAAECGCLVQRGEARMLLGDERGAEQDLLHALDLAAEHGYVGLARNTGDEGSMLQASALLKDLYRKQRRYTEALDMTQRWAMLRDSLQRLSGREQLVIQALHERLQVDSLAQVDLLARERSAHAAAMVRQRERQRWIVLVSLLGLAMLGAMVAGMAHRRRMDLRLAELERARSAQDRIIAEYRIREQLARDLHDDLGVGLSALKLKSELAQRQPNGEGERSSLSELSQISNELLVNMRQIIWSMDEAQGSLADTVAHCLDHARRYLAENRIAVDVHAPEAWPELHLPAIVRRNLFLIVKEALHNVVKHAGADRVRISFELQGDRLVLTIADNGRGLADKEPGRGRHGLGNMRKRAEALQGGLHISSAAGTTMTCTIPLPC